MTYRPDRVTFRVLLIEPRTRRIYADMRHQKRYSLPTVSIPRWSRATPHVQGAIARKSGYLPLVLDYSPGHLSTCPLVVSQTISAKPHQEVAGSWVDYEELYPGSLTTGESEWVERLIATGASGRGLYSRLGWHSEVLEWIHSASCRLSGPVRIRQMNASSQSALLCIQDGEGSKLWFKSAPREYEVSLRITRRLSPYLPRILEHRRDWRAWLMEDAGSSFAIASNLTPKRLGDLGRRLARLQIDSCSHRSELIASGCQNLQISVLRESLRDLLQTLDRTREQLRSRRYPAYSIQSLETTLISILDEWEDIQIPDTLSHTDLALSNILTGGERCVFVDWANAAVATPFANFTQVQIQLSRPDISPRARSVFATTYLDQWSGLLKVRQVENALRLSSAVEMITRLCARRYWLTSGILSREELANCSKALLRQLHAVLLETHPRFALTG